MTRRSSSVRAILDEGPGIQPVDLYSVTGLPGADFRSMPYFPPYLADELLDRAVDSPRIVSGCRRRASIF